MYIWGVILTGKLRGYRRWQRSDAINLALAEAAGKYKQCCALKEAKTPVALRIVVAVVAVFLLGGLVVFLTNIDDYDPNASSTAGRVWSEEHGHWH